MQPIEPRDGRFAALAGLRSQGCITTPESPDPAGDTTLCPRIDYFSIPVLAKMRLETGSVHPYVVGGPRVDLRAGSSAGFSNVFEEFRGADLGLTLGVGMEFALGQAGPFLLESRYSPSLEYSYEGEFVRVRNRSFEFLLGISL